MRLNMSKTSVLSSYWPSALLSLVLLIGICACFKRFNCAEIGEVKALISILFGFATSCLLLSFIWLLQRRPFNRPWPNQAQFTGAMLPSMHPGGRIESIEDQLVVNNNNHHVNIRTISSQDFDNDKPPDYKDALANSKPIAYQNQIDYNHYQQQQQHQNERKISYVQLDVGQLLIISTSPPKYSQLYCSNSDTNSFLNNLKQYNNSTSSSKHLI